MERRMPKRHVQQTQPAPAKKMAKNITGFAFFAGLLIVVAIAFFYAHKEKQDTTIDNTTASEAERLINKDLEVGYPDTPTEVLKLFGRMNQCIYNNNMSDKQFDELVNQMRLLYSNSLLSQNPFEELGQIQDNSEPGLRLCADGLFYERKRKLYEVIPRIHIGKRKWKMEDIVISKERIQG